jgi:hypothetical protein
LGFISSSQGKERAAAMWVEILCGLLAYKILQRVFFAGGDDASYLADLDSSHSDLCFAVASRFLLLPNSSESLYRFIKTRETHPTDPIIGSDSPSRLEKLYAGRCFVGLRIPDPDAGERQHIDVVLVTKRLVCHLGIYFFCL